MRTHILALAATLTAGLALAGCAVEGDKISTGSLKPIDGPTKSKRARPASAEPAAEAAQARQPGDARKLYCDEVRRSWKQGDMPPSADALEKRKADNIYCAG